MFRTFQYVSLQKKLLVALLIVLPFLLIGMVQLAQPAQQTQTATVRSQTIAETVTETGNIQANQVSVYSPTDGIVEELFVKNGDTVYSGQQLFAIKAAATEEEKADALANYQDAASALKTAEQKKQNADAAMWAKQQGYITTQNTQQYKNEHTQNPDTNNNYTDREKIAIDSGVVQAEKDFRAAEKTYLEADVAIASAKAKLTATQIKYQKTQDTIVKAPVKGTVDNLSFDVGDTVMTKSITGTGTTSVTTTPVLVLGANAGVVVKISLSEGDINKIKEGQRVEIMVDAIKEKTFTGIVSRMDKFGTDTAGVITYNVYIRITNPSNVMKPLMSVTASIETTRHENALVVPNAAIKPYKSGKAVQVIEKQQGKIYYVPVKTGIKTSSITEVVDGLTEGQEVTTNTSTNTTPSDEQEEESNKPSFNNILINHMKE